MSIELYFAFIAAVLVLVAIPGPNVALIVANSVAHGRRYGLVTVAGTSAAMLPQLGLTLLGMTALLSTLSEWLVWVRWLGVAYLLYLGVQAWRAPAVDLTSVPPEPRSAREIFLRGFLVSLTNPKTLLFYGAFFPQFVSSEGNLAAQLALLSVTFLALAVVGDSGWAVAGAHFRRVLAVRGKLRNRITGGFYIAAALGLAAARKPA
jgi:threonine/homoserine/homoserine lactone efflux protein